MEINQIILLDNITRSKKKREKNKKKLQSSQKNKTEILIVAQSSIAGLSVNRTNYPTKDTKCQVGFKQTLVLNLCIVG